MTEMRWVAVDEQGTDRFGQLLADCLPAGTVVALLGTLGAGKTRLVRSVAAALGVVPDHVTSPTFVLINEYVSGRMPLYHFDAYRLRDDDEFLELGPEEYFEGAGLTFVEWADRVAACLPTEYLSVAIEVIGDTGREFSVVSSSSALEPIVSKLAAAAIAT